MKIILTILLVINYLSALPQIKTKYVIKNITELTGKMYVNAKQISTNTSRKNVAGTKIILKFEGGIPEVFKNDSIYNHRSIHIELDKEEWKGYSGGLKIVDKFIITDSPYKDQIAIKINEWMYIEPILIKDDMWAVPYDLYLKYQSTIDGKIDLFKFVIKDLRKKEFITQL